MKNISLTSAMSMNLLSLKQTSSAMSEVQNRLATGLKVNSAIDNPSAYYTAVSLNNRASDLSVLLDTMSQGIQTIKAANEALETGTAVLQQAKAVAEKAGESSVDIVAKVHNEAELLAAVEKGGAGYIIVESDINLTNQIQLKDGQKLVGDNYFAGNDGPNRKLSFDFTGKSGDAILAGNKSIVSNLDISFESDSSINNNGVIAARGTKNVTISNINLTFDTPNVVSGSSFGIMANGGSDIALQGNINIQGLNNMSTGIGVYGKTTIDNYADLNISAKFHGIKIGDGLTNQPNSAFNTHNNTTINVTASTDAEIVIFAASSFRADHAKINIVSEGAGFTSSENSHVIFSGTELNIRSSKNVALNISSAVINILNSRLNLESENSRAVRIWTTRSFPYSSSLNIDNNSRLNIKTSMDTNSRSAISLMNDVEGKEVTVNIAKGAEINITRNSAADALWYFDEDYHYRAVSDKWGYLNDFDGYADKSAAEDFPDGAPDIPDIADKLSETFSGDVSLEETKPDNRTYSETLSQYDMLINDASYKGINLLQSNNLKINFNEERTSSIEIKGVDASAEGLGIHSLEWKTQMDLLNSVEELENAINKLRSFSAEFGNYYSIVTTREDFTENLINVLTEGADKLILADMNEESANMLALQTSQQLAINSLSLASQAGQSVLRLFA